MAGRSSPTSKFRFFALFPLAAAALPSAPGQHPLTMSVLALSVNADALPPLPEGEALAGRASPAVRLGPMWRKAPGPVLIGSRCFPKYTQVSTRESRQRSTAVPALRRLCSNSRATTGSPVALPLGATATTAACGRHREELLGQRPARRECRSRHEADAGSRNPPLARKRLRGLLQKDQREKSVSIIE